MSKDKILYFAPRINTFTGQDIGFLSKRFNLKLNTFNWKKKHLLIFFAVRQFFFLLFQILGTKAIVISFGGYWSFLPSMFGKLFNVPVYIILNGADSAYIPEFKYGFLKKGTLLNWLCKKSYHWADKLLPVSDSLIQTENTFIPLSNPKQGILNHFPDLKTPIEVLYNGLDTSKWERKEAFERDSKAFLAVFASHQIYLKGMDLIDEMASHFQDCSFYIVGITENDFQSKNKNVFLLGRKSPENLKAFYNKCQYYFQLSASEAFGIALCEAMLCEAIPIGSSVNIIPNIIGEAGFVLKKRNADMLKDLIQEALQKDGLNELGKKGRESILERFPIELREKKLLEAIQ